MQRDKRLPFLVSSVDCLRSWLGRFARLENRFVDCIPGRHGDTMPFQRFPMPSSALLFHGPVFHRWCCCFPRIWPWTFAAWSIWMEADLRGNSYWRHGLDLHSRTYSRSLSPKKIRRGLIARRAVWCCLRLVLTRASQSDRFVGPNLARHENPRGSYQTSVAIGHR